MFELSTSTKISMVVGATALLLFGIGYILHTTTELINEIDKRDENVESDTPNAQTNPNTPNASEK
jgi:hypothetical protein